MRLLLVLCTALVVGGCLNTNIYGTPTPTPTPSESAPAGPFRVRSSAFEPGQPIPREHSCDNMPPNLSPALTFSDAPPNTTHVALIMEDPDAPSGTILHWTFWNLPRNVTDLPKQADPTDHGARVGQSYRSPCPPLPRTHRYFFYAYGLDAPLELAAGASVADLRAALQGHVTATDSMHGTYMRTIPPL